MQKLGLRVKGENQIAFELKNSGMDMLIMHDLYLEKNGLSAQIDFLVITRKHFLLLNAKTFMVILKLMKRETLFVIWGKESFIVKKDFRLQFPKTKGI